MNMRRALGLVLACALIGPLFTARVEAAADKELQRVRGPVSYAKDLNGPKNTVVTSLELPDDAFAITGPAAVAIVRLKDSSEITLGENTKVQVGAFSPAESGKENVITLAGGKMRFDIRRPPGGKSNYTFSTATSQISVRGTSGLLETGADGDTIGCITCEAGDLTVTTGGKQYALITGQVLKVALTGAVVIGALTAAIAGQFAGAGVSAAASSAAGAGAAGAGAAGAGAASAGAAAAGAGAAAAGAGIAGAAVAAGAAIAAAAVVVVAAKPAATTAPSPSPGPISVAIVGSLSTVGNSATITASQPGYSGPFTYTSSNSAVASLSAAGAASVGRGLRACSGPPQSVTVSGGVIAIILCSGPFSISVSGQGGTSSTPPQLSGQLPQPSPSPSPSPQRTAAPTPTPAVTSTPSAAPSATPSAAPSATPSPVATATATASPTPTPAPHPAPIGAAPNQLSFSSASTQSVAVSESGNTAGYTASWTCAPGAAIGVNGSPSASGLSTISGPAPSTTLSVSAASGPTVATNPACTITVTDPANSKSVSIQVSITITNLNITGTKRKMESLPLPAPLAPSVPRKPGKVSYDRTLPDRAKILPAPEQPDEPNEPVFA